ncbi:MAG TPA: ATP-binding protein [Streptosporangiaceae bacterium]|nr:ATP-binding protein [Streptosporangiaceae bacterium]
MTRHSFSQGTWSLRRRLGYAFAIAGALLAVGCLVGGLALNGMVGAVDLQINRLDPAARETSNLLSSLLGEETGVRGYILTGQQSFLAPYRDGVVQTAGHLARLHGLVDPYPALGRRLRAVEAQADLWRTGYAAPAVATVMQHGTVTAASETTGEQDFDRARADISALSKAILAEHDTALRRLHSLTTAVIVVAITGAIALVAAGAAAWAAMNAWVTAPLAALSAEAQAVASGGLGRVLKVSGPQEIMALAADVEAMRRQLLSGLDDLSFKATELERSNRELEQFAYVASHDLQEPLRKVASFCQMLESRYAGQLDERAHQYITFAVDGAKRMQLLINELLMFSRVGQPGTVRACVDLNTVASEVTDRLDATIADADAQIIVGELPTVDGDQTLLSQLFQNLIANSIKFRRLDEHPVVRISAEPGEGIWTFACEDNGIGIAPAHAERVFVIFQRLHPRDAYPGTGIGLALCRKIVDFHGGRIWVDTSARTGEGTTVRWTLPESDGHKETT